MLRTLSIIAMLTFAVSVANAEPMNLTDTQMDASAEPMKLSDTQMDSVSAGDLTLPNDKKIFEGFDNPAPGNLHPTLLMGVGMEGPWQAHFNSDQINCADC